jgi:hypothetical protein
MIANYTNHAAKSESAFGVFLSKLNVLSMRSVEETYPVFLRNTLARLSRSRPAMPDRQWLRKVELPWRLFRPRPVSPSKQALGNALRPLR